jgi:hypothetical protein
VAKIGSGALLRLSNSINRDPASKHVPPQNTSRLKTRFFASHYHYKMRNKYLQSLRIDKAVAALQRGDFIHYSNVAIKYKCDQGALSRRIRGLTKSKKQADSF